MNTYIYPGMVGRAPVHPRGSRLVVMIGPVAEYINLPVGSALRGLWSMTAFDRPQGARMVQITKITADPGRVKPVEHPERIPDEEVRGMVLAEVNRVKMKVAPADMSNPLNYLAVRGRHFHLDPKRNYYVPVDASGNLLYRGKYSYSYQQLQRLATQFGWKPQQLIH